MAYTQKRGDKYYACFVDASGKPRQRAGYHSERETQKLADRLEDEQARIRLGDIDPQQEARRLQRAKPIAQHVHDYQQTLEATANDPGTNAYVLNDIRALIDFAEASGDRLASASLITWQLIDRWIADQKKRQRAKEYGHANATINRRVGSVQQFLRHLHAHGGVTEYVLNKYPKLPTTAKHRTRQARPFAAGELDALLSTDAIPLERRQRYAVAVKSGLRMGELRQMIGRYFQTADSLIHVPADVAKAKTDQGVPMHPEVAAIVTPRIKLNGPDARIFSMPTKRHVIDELREDCVTAGIFKTIAEAKAAGVGFHALRHTFCTNLARKNVHPALLQKLARHSDLATTLRYYVHLQRSDEQAAISLL